MNLETWLTYDDVLLLPKYSEIEHRDDVNLKVEIAGLEFGHPIVLANMKTIGTTKMYKGIANTDPLFILHRFMSAKEAVTAFQQNQSIWSSVGGMNKENRDLVDLLMFCGQDSFCVDVAHGDHKMALEMVKYIKSKAIKNFVIAGNVCINDGALRLKEAGADIIKVGVGPGSICTTRIQTGNGAPQLTALESIRKAIGDTPIIADGGIKNSGDIVKALCFADMVMVGNLFAGTMEAEGEIVQTREGNFKRYEGSSTLKNRFVEGVKGQAPFKGKYACEVLQDLLDGVRSGLSYQGCNKLSEFRKDNPEFRFVRMTNNGLNESKPHNVFDAR
jgi:IMP dehydrogenase